MAYVVDSSRAGKRYYVTSGEPGDNTACSARLDVCETIANFLNNLPTGIEPLDIVKAFGGGKPYGNLSLPDGDKEQFFIDESMEKILFDRLSDR